MANLEINDEDAGWLIQGIALELERLRRVTSSYEKSTGEIDTSLPAVAAYGDGLIRRIQAAIQAERDETAAAYKHMADGLEPDDIPF